MNFTEFDYEIKNKYKNEIIRNYNNPEALKVVGERIFIETKEQILDYVQFNKKFYKGKKIFDKVFTELNGYNRNIINSCDYYDVNIGYLAITIEYKRKFVISDYYEFYYGEVKDENLMLELAMKRL